MKMNVSLTLTLSAVMPLALNGQAAPSVSPTITPPAASQGGSTTHVGGELTYTLSGSESYVTGYQGTQGSSSSTSLSGQAEYVSNSERHPMSAIYAGGYFFGNNSAVRSSVYQNLGVSQLLLARHWRLGVADTVSFLPSSPLYGVSGVPGSGDVGSTPITTGGIPNQSILTNYGEQISNTVSGSASRDLTGKTFVHAFGSSSIQRFLQTGLNNNAVTASGTLGHQFNQLNSLSAIYTYSQFFYSTTLAGINSSSFRTHGLAASYGHIFTRKLSMQISAGPAWVSSNTPALIPGRVLFSSAVSITYAGRRTSASATYSRSPNVGSGVLLGALSDDMNVNIQHIFSTRWSGGLTANYGRASGLATLPGENAIVHSFYGGAQANRRISESFSAFGSYSAATQTGSGLALTQNAFNGTEQILSVGLTYTPRTIHFGRP